MLRKIDLDVVIISRFKYLAHKDFYQVRRELSKDLIDLPVRYLPPSLRITEGDNYVTSIDLMLTLHNVKLKVEDVLFDIYKGHYGHLSFENKSIFTKGIVDFLEKSRARLLKAYKNNYKVTAEGLPTYETLHSIFWMAHLNNISELPNKLGATLSDIKKLRDNLESLVPTSSNKEIKDTFYTITGYDFDEHVFDKEAVY